MFDLPTGTPSERRKYNDFRQSLLKDGFVMIQYSVYARHCPSDENAEVHRRRIQLALPDEGEVRILTITDKQFEKMLVFFGKHTKPTEKPPQQLTFL